MKKIISVMLCIILAVCMTVSANAASTVTASSSASSVAVGETVTVMFSISSTTVRAISVSPSYDKTVFELVSGSWSLSGTSVANFDVNTGLGVAQYTDETVISGSIFTLVLKAKAEASSVSISATFSPRNAAEGTTSTTSNSVSVTVTPAPHDHTYGDWQTSDIQHWKECSVTNCTEKSQLGDHVYDNACDTRCNTCGYTRIITHSYKNTYTTDSTSHWYECSVCGDKKDITAHDYTELKYDTSNHWNECVCGAKESIEAHKGGIATCQAKSICSVCNQEYGTFGNHTWTDKVDESFLKTAGNCTTKAVYYKSCSVCGQKGTATFEGEIDPNVHNSTDMDYDNTHHWGSCSRCGEGDDVKVEHTLSYNHNATYHWQKCSGCEYETDKVEHSGGTATCQAKAICSVCNEEYGFTLSHDFIETADAEYLKTEANCKDPAVYYKSCSVCEQAGTETFTSGSADESKHNYSTTYSQDSGNHWFECSACGDKKDITAHGYTEQKFDTNSHWNECVCGAKDAIEAHKGGTATCTSKAICEVCNQPYGTGSHTAVFVPAKDATDASNGNIAHYRCNSCWKYFLNYNCTIEVSYSNIVTIYNAPTTCEQYGHNMVAVSLGDDTHAECCLNGCGTITTSKHSFGLDSVCRICGHILEIDEDDGIIVAVDEPVESTTEEEEAKTVSEQQPTDDNPATGVACSTTMIAICALAVVFNKKR